ELRDGRRIVPRQLREWIRAVAAPVEIEEVIGRLRLETGRAPGIRIDRPRDERRPVALEERTNLGRQQGNRLVGDELVRLESPREGGDGRRHGHQERNSGWQ